MNEQPPDPNSWLDNNQFRNLTQEEIDEMFGYEGE